MPDELIVRVESPSFVGKLIVEDGTIVDASPVLRRNVGKRYELVKRVMAERTGWALYELLE